MSEPAGDTRLTKNQRTNLRATNRQAERVLAGRRWFIATDDQFNEFTRLLDAPLPSTSKFEKLLAPPSVFSDEA